MTLHTIKNCIFPLSNYSLGCWYFFPSYPSNCQVSTVPDLTIRLVRLPLTDTVRNSVWARDLGVTSQSSDGKDHHSTGQLISTTGRVVPMYSLILRSSRSLKQPLTISSNALLQGVWLFPSVELSWIPLAKPDNTERIPMSTRLTWYRFMFMYIVRFDASVFLIGVGDKLRRSQ